MKDTYTDEPSRSAALAGALNRAGIETLRYGLVIVLLWIGGMKFTSYEAAGIAPLEMHSPLMNWLYLCSHGATECLRSLGSDRDRLGRRNRTTLRISARLRYSQLLSVGMFLTTLSFLFTTP